MPTNRESLTQLAAEVGAHEQVDISLMRIAGILEFPAYPLLLDFDNERLSVPLGDDNQRNLKPTSFEFRCIGYLASNADSVLPREQILDAVRGNAIGKTRVVDVHLSRLRAKFSSELGLNPLWFPVRTIRKKGFIFDSSPTFDPVTGERIGSESTL